MIERGEPITYRRDRLGTARDSALLAVLLLAPPSEKPPRCSLARLLLSLRELHERAFAIAIYSLV